MLQQVVCLGSKSKALRAVNVLPSPPWVGGIFMGAVWNSTGKFSHLERKGSWSETRGCGRRHWGKGLSTLIFSHQKMSLFCWVGLIRNWAHTALSTCWFQAPQRRGAVREGACKHIMGLGKGQKKYVAASEEERVTKPTEVIRNIFPNTSRTFVYSTPNTEPLHPSGVGLNSCSLHLRW